MRGSLTTREETEQMENIVTERSKGTYNEIIGPFKKRKR